MRLYLFRHGPAGSRDDKRWPDDALRPLTDRGVDRTAQAAAGLARLERGSVVVWSSPFRRALETARIVVGALDRDAALDECEALAPDGDPEEIIRRLAAVRAAEAVVLVGHEPGLGRLAGALLFGAADHALALKKAGACLLTFDGPVRACQACLKALLPPRVLRRLAGKGARV